QPERPTGEGKLSEIPFGVKDIIETKGLTTEYGSPIYKGRIGTADAAIVRELRRRGGVLFGKTQTTEFAYRTPAPTPNPRDLRPTPGGGSSASAAAVAAGMVPLALGTQTAGSVVRPASFCGVAGFKPTYGLVPTEGVLVFARSLDTLGFFTETAADMLAVWGCLGFDTGTAEEFVLGVPNPMFQVDPVMDAAFQSTLSRLRGAGDAIRPVDVAGMITKLTAAHRTVMYFEGARSHEQHFTDYGSQLADLADLVCEGLEIPLWDYEDAKRSIEECKRTMTEV